MLTYLPYPLFLSRALFERIEPNECNNIFLASEASNVARMSKCQNVDHTDAGLCQGKLDAVFVVPPLPESRLKGFDLFGEMVGQFET